MEESLSLVAFVLWSKNVLLVNGTLTGRHPRGGPLFIIHHFHLHLSFVLGYWLISLFVYYGNFLHFQWGHFIISIHAILCHFCCHAHRHFWAIQTNYYFSNMVANLLINQFRRTLVAIFDFNYSVFFFFLCY